MKNKISQFINTKPTKFQIAKDNKWEESWIMDLSANPPKVNDIKKYLDKSAYSYLAVEYQWDQPEGAYVFNMGHSKSCKLQDHQEFFSTMLDLAYKYSNFVKLIDSIDNKVIGREYLFTRDLDFIRVSIFNHWFSSGPVDLWKKGLPREMSKKKLSKLFKGHENLLKTTLNFQAMAFAYSYDFEKKDFGVRYIMKVPSSKKINSTWLIDFDLMLKYLQEWEGFRIS